jgi:hypothetical protein
VDAARIVDILLEDEVNRNLVVPGTKRDWSTENAQNILTLLDRMSKLARPGTVPSKIVPIDGAIEVLNSLPKPYQDALYTYIKTNNFSELVGTMGTRKPEVRSRQYIRILVKKALENFYWGLVFADYLPS